MQKVYTKKETINLIIFLSTGNWEINTRQRFILAVNKELVSKTPDSKVLCIERPVCPLSSPFIKPKEWFNKITGRSKLRKLQNNIYLMTPWVLIHDIASRYIPYMEVINRKLIELQIKKAAKIINMNGSKNVLWICHPYQKIYSDIFPEAVILYECYDAYEEFTLNERLKKRIEDDEGYILSIANFVIATSKFLADRCRLKNKNVYIIPNGVDYNHFSLPCPGIINTKQYTKPIVGFVGKINQNIKFELVNSIAMLKPNWTFIYLGLYDGSIGFKNDPEYKKSQNISNIHYLGFIKYDMLPAYISAMDACIIPFVQNKMMDAVYPLKINEYLAAGKPVVSTRQLELEPFAQKGLVSFADEPELFIKKLEGAMNNDGVEKMKERKKEACLNDWQKRAAYLIEILRDI